MATKPQTPIANTTTTTEEASGCHPGERAFWLSLGLSYCDRCCNPRGTNVDGSTRCRMDEPETCPLILGE